MSYSIKIFPNWSVVVKPDGTNLATCRNIEDAVKIVRLLNAENIVDADSFLLADYFNWVTGSRYLDSTSPCHMDVAIAAAKRILSRHFK